MNVGMSSPRQVVTHLCVTSFAGQVLLCAAEQLDPHFEHWVRPAFFRWSIASHQSYQMLSISLTHNNLPGKPSNHNKIWLVHASKMYKRYNAKKLHLPADICVKTRRLCRSAMSQTDSPEESSALHFFLVFEEVSSRIEDARNLRINHGYAEMMDFLIDVANFQTFTKTMKNEFSK